ncbi:MAG: hypothetical protein BMS9Abin11_0643 [Gammaproteobacteria bacterium]|nr:MAG: hypothetical protein BMS9Abin11_0643 [Gammaproteobacteria bacterium]
MSIVTFRHPLVLLVVLLFITVAAYFNGLSGPFVFDDIVHIVNNPSIHITELNRNTLKDAITYNYTDLSQRPVAALSFALNHYLAGGVNNALWYKVTNLAIHLVNVLLVFSLVRLLRQYMPAPNKTPKISPEWFALAVAAMWALHPIQLTSVLYVVQRMNSLATFFVLAGLLTYITGRKRIDAGRPGGYWMMNTGLIAGAGLGFLSKENALLIIPLALLVEIVVFRILANWRTFAKPLLINQCLLLLAPLVIAALWLLFNSDYVLSAYNARHFSLIERLLTESRVLFQYLYLIIFPNINHFTLFHDDIPISSGLLSPATTLLSILLLIGIIGLAVTARKKHALLTFGVFWFFIGHSMESTIFALEIAHEHRNYLPSIGLFMVLVYGIEKIPRVKDWNIAMVTLSLIPIVLFGATYLRADRWSSESRLITHMWQNHPRSARAIYMQAENLTRYYGQQGNAMKLLISAINRAPHEVAYMLRLLTLADESFPEYRSPGNGKHFVLFDNNKIALADLFVKNKPPASGKAIYSLNQQLDIFITKKLRQGRLSNFSLISLDRLYACLSRKKRPCRILLPHTINWFRMLLQRKTINILNRKKLTIYLADSLILSGRYTESIAVAKTGIAIMPNNTTIKFILANGYILNGNRQKALAILNDITNSKPGLNRHDRQVWTDLRNMTKNKSIKKQRK